MSLFDLFKFQQPIEPAESEPSWAVNYYTRNTEAIKAHDYYTRDGVKVTPGMQLYIAENDGNVRRVIAEDWCAYEWSYAILRNALAEARQQRKKYIASRLPEGSKLLKLLNDGWLIFEFGGTQFLAQHKNGGITMMHPIKIDWDEQQQIQDSVDRLRDAGIDIAPDTIKLNEEEKEEE